MRKTASLLTMALLWAGPASSAPPASPFVAVLIDAKTEAALGTFPYDRKVYADAVKAARLAGAKAVVLKFFLHEPGSPAGDAALERELGLIPAFLQARIDDSWKNPNPYPERFLLKDAKGRFANALGGSSGWVPLERFSKAAKGVGFADLASADRPTTFPLVEVYQGRVVPSLYLSVLQWLLGAQPLVVDGVEVVLGARKLPLASGDEADVWLPPVAALDYVPFLDLVKGRAPAERLRGKVVLLGYDGDKQTTFKTKAGKLGAHRLSYFALTDLYSKLAPLKR